MGIIKYIIKISCSKCITAQYIFWYDFQALLSNVWLSIGLDEMDTMDRNVTIAWQIKALTKCRINEIHHNPGLYLQLVNDIPIKIYTSAIRNPQRRSAIAISTINTYINGSLQWGVSIFLRTLNDTCNLRLKQLGAVISRSNITWCCIHRCSDACGI